jgi:hypothetical protein
MQMHWKTDPNPNTVPFGWIFESKDARAQYIKDHPAEIYWYHFPEEDDGWVKGPAWKLAAADAAVARQEEPSDVDADDRW